MTKGYFLSAKEWLLQLLPVADIELPEEETLENILISPSKLVRDPIYGAVTETSVIVRRQFDLKIPGMEWIYPSFGGSEQAIRLAYSVQPKVNGELGPLPVTLNIELDSLEPMRRVLDGEALIGFEPDPDKSTVRFIVEESYLSYHHEKGLGFGSQFAVSVPPFRIAGTELILAADHAAIILRDDGVDQDLLNLGMSPAFRGIFASGGVLYWLPQIQLMGYDMPGLRLDFDNIAIGNEGVSLSVLSSWVVVIKDDGTFDEQQTELLGVFMLPSFVGANSATGSLTNPDTSQPDWLQALKNGTGIGSSEWQLAIAEVGGSIRKNLPQGFRVKAYMRVPFFDAIFSTDFQLSYYIESGQHHYQTQLSLRKETEQTISLAYLDNNLLMQLSQLELEGRLSQNGFSIEGTASFAFNLFGLEVEADSANMAYEHSAHQDKFRFSLHQVTLGELGTTDEATLKLSVKRQESDWIIEELTLTGSYQWQSLAPLIPPQIRDNIQLPADGNIEAQLQWESDSGETGSNYQLVVRLFTGMSHIDRFWHFIPVSYRPQVERLETLLKLTYANTAAFNQNTGSAPQNADERDDLSVELSALMQLKLPWADWDVPGMELISFYTGNVEGLIEAELKASYSSSLEEGEAFQTGLTLLNPFSLQLAFPGTSPDQPFIHTAFTRIGLQFQISEQNDSSAADTELAALADGQNNPAIGGRLLAEGSFDLHPLLPADMPFATALNNLTAEFGMQNIEGRASTSLSFSDSTFDLDISGEFENAGVHLDIFNLMEVLSHSTGGPAGAAFDIDFDIHFEVIGFRFRIGYGESPEAPADNTTEALASEAQFYFSSELKLSCKMSGLPEVGASIRLSNEAFSLALENIDVPLEMPLYPINNEDLARLRGDDGRWSASQGASYAEILNQEISSLEALLNDPNVPPHKQFRLTKDKLHLELKRLFLQLIMEIHQRIASSGQAVFEGLVEADTWLHATALQLMHFETSLKLHFPKIKLNIPFADPAGIALEGSGQLLGFADNDPLKAIENYHFAVGLSTEYIYLRFDSDNTSIPIPDFDTRYTGGSITISKFMLGYGYTKNSFALDFAGSLILPPALVNDADTSALVGVGIRLPQHTQLAFTIDLIPVTIGKASFLLPVPRFDLDLRNPLAPALVSTARCEPYWDGLQFIATDLLRADLKRIAFSPFFGPAIAPNAKFDGDLKLGSDENGATLIIDDMLSIFGIYAGTSTFLLQVPFFADPMAPYFQNVCVNLRAAGFQLNFNLQRPFPSFSPMALIEVFALISDPMIKIDPKGTLANTIRMSLTDAWVQVPDHVLKMFPEAANLVNQQYNFTLNLGTLITLVQGMVDVGSPAIEWLKALADNASTNIQTLINRLADTDTADFDPWRWIQLLPPELRKFRVGGQIAGFSGSACLVLATEQEARQALNQPAAAQNLAALTMDTSDGDTLLFYERHEQALSDPITGAGAGFSQHWLPDQQGRWSQHNERVIYLKGGQDSLIFYQGEAIPDAVEIAMTLRFSQTTVDSQAGFIFCLQADGQHYLLTLAAEAETDDSTAKGILIRLRRVGTSETTSLWQTRINKRISDQYNIALTTYLHAQERHFDIRLGGQTSQLKATAINHCMDAHHPLAFGRFGLYGSGKHRVEFSQIRMTPVILRSQTMGRVSQTSLSKGFNVNLTTSRETLNGAASRSISRDESGTLFKGIEFEPFTHGRLGSLPLDRLPHLDLKQGSIWMAARLNLFQGQRLRFLGQLFADGSFALLAQASSRPLQLSVFGLDINLPFDASAEMTLAGRQRRNGFYGSVQAKGYIDWSPIPNIVRFRAGSQQQPCVLQLQSDGTFKASGIGEVELFSGAAKVSAEILITEQKAAFDGRLQYELGINLPDYPFANIIALDIHGTGQVESLSRYRFSGRGDVRLLGDLYSSVDVSINQDKVLFDVFYRKGINNVATELERQYPILRQCDIALNARCEVSMRRTVRPHFRLRGEGHIRVLGAEIQGVGELRSLPKPDQSLKQDKFLAVMEGTLRWQGRDWLGGRVEVGSRGLMLKGETRFGLHLTPASVDSLNLELASLFLDINLNGEFRLDAEKQKVTFRFEGYWTLGAAMANTGEASNRQILPLASNRFQFNSEGSIAPGLAFTKELIHINGFKFFPFEQFTIPLPSIDIGVRQGASSILRIGEISDIPVARFKLPDDEYLWLQGTVPPLIGRPQGEWQSGSFTLYSPNDYRVNFDANDNELPVDLNQFSDLKIELRLDADMDSGFPMKLRVIGPDGNRRDFGLA